MSPDRVGQNMLLCETGNGWKIAQGGQSTPMQKGVKTLTNSQCVKLDYWAGVHEVFECDNWKI